MCRLFSALVIFSSVIFSACQSNIGNTKLATSSLEENKISDRRIASNYVVQNYPILQAIEANGGTLFSETKSWMKKWKGLDLEDRSMYVFPELTGSTSINMKVKKIDSNDPDGFKAKGTFVPRNSSGNPYLEIAYFNMAAILGFDHLIRPAIRYELGPAASSAFKDLINKSQIKGKNRLENRTRILAAIATGKPLLGCLKAKKPDSEGYLDSMADTNAGPTGGPKMSHPVIQALQASQPLPTSDQMIQLSSKNKGNLLVLAHEYSILMTLDSVFQQWDRYSGGNIGIAKDEQGLTHFFFTDNGGADISKTGNWAVRNLNWFSRYDRNVIAKLKDIYNFLDNPSHGFLGYTNAESFVVDLGLYSELQPAVYAERLKRNLKLLLDQVEKTEARYGKSAYFD